MVNHKVSREEALQQAEILISRISSHMKAARKLAEALLKARCVLGGHQDLEAGEHSTAVPTVGPWPTKMSAWRSYECNRCRENVKSTCAC